MKRFRLLIVALVIVLALTVLLAPAVFAKKHVDNVYPPLSDYPTPTTVVFPPSWFEKPPLPW